MGRGLPLAAALAIGIMLAPPARARSLPTPRFDGFNVIAVAGHPFGSESARLALIEARQLGTRAIAVVPFFWQPNPASPDLVRGKDMTDDELRAAIRDAHALGLAVIVKPQVWVPHSWAGAVAMNSEAEWAIWFAQYRTALDGVVRVAAEEQAEALAIGTELVGTSQRPEWNEMIADVRARYCGNVLYMAHNVEEAERIPFWSRLDAIGVTLYPPLGPDDDRVGRFAVMSSIAARLDALSARSGKPIIVGEIGLRSARGAAEKPWESAEERKSAPDPSLQAEVLADWLSILERPAIHGVMVWRWLTDPNAGGLNDTDFTVQGKPAQRVLMCAWKGRRCVQDQARMP